MKLPDLSVRRPVGLIMIVLGILALGFVSLTNLPIDLFPDIDLPIAAVTTSYPGAGPQEIEQLISRPLETSLSSLQGINTIQSISQPNASLVLLMFDTGTNLDNALLEVRERIDMIKGMLPEQAGDPRVLRFDPQQIPIMYLGLGGADLDKLQETADNYVIPYLERVEDVASVSASGGRVREIHVIPDMALMSRYGISPSQIAQALQMENRSASAGVITKGSQEMQIRIQGEFTSLDDIKNTSIVLNSGERITVGDVADVVDTYAETTSITEVNGEQALLLSVLKESDGNTVNAADGLYKAIDRIQESLPEGMNLSIVFDTSVFIRDSIRSITENLLIGGAVALIILIFFLRSVRPVIVIGVSIPISVIATFTLMYFTGETLNIVSMGGLALGVGLIVDNSIVILEHIFTQRQRGVPPLEAAKIGASEVGPAIVAATMTTLVVFLPVVFVEGIASDLMTPMALTVCFSLFASLMVALTIVPMMASRILPDKTVQAQDKEGGVNRWFIVLKNGYRRSLKWVLNHRKTTVAVTAIAFVLSFVLVPFIGAELAPESDQGMMDIVIEAPSGTDLEEMKELVDEIKPYLEPYEPIIESQFLTIGSGDLALGVTSNQAILSLQLIPSSQRDITTEQVAQELRESFETIPGVDFEVVTTGVSFSTGAPIQIQLSGPEFDVLREIADEIAFLVSTIEGTHNVETSFSEGRPEIQIDINRDMLHLYGLSYMQIMQHVEMAFSGQVATRYREGGGEYDVRIILPEEDRTTISSLETLLIPTATGTLVPLSTIAELKQVDGPMSITRHNQQRQVNITGEIVGRDLYSVSNEINALLSELTLPDGYEYSFGGEFADMEETFIELGTALLFAIFLVYVVMAVQFESIFYPLVVMFSMPTMVIGVLIGLFITNTPISMMVLIGLIMLAGIVVNNAIVLIDYVNLMRRRGMERFEAIVEAGPARLRAILMTTLTTLLAMVPMALGLGEGSEQQVPLAITIIFGLTTSSVFTLLFVPVMYTILDDISSWIKRKVFRRSVPAPASETGADA